MSKIAGMELSDIALVAGVAGAAFLLYKPLSTASNAFEDLTSPIAQVEQTAADAFTWGITNTEHVTEDAYNGISGWANNAWQTISGWFS